MGDRENSHHKTPRLSENCESIVPVILKLDDGDRTFVSLGVYKTKSFGDNLIQRMGNPKDSYFGKGGDLFVFPVTNDQQKKLLNIRELGGLKFTASLPKSLTRNVRVIHDVPQSITEDELLTDFEKYKVLSVERLKRKKSDGSTTILEKMKVMFEDHIPENIYAESRSTVAQILTYHSQRIVRGT